MQRPEKLKRVRKGVFKEPWNIEKLQVKIDELPKSERKKRLLFVGEASFLKTGFSTYWEAVINRLYATGKYEIAELGSYARSSDGRAKNLPWTFYGAIPEEADKIGSQLYQKNYQEAQFGKMMMDPVLAKFKPDIVLTLTDHWMAYFWEQSVFRDKFHWIFMACVDSYPQKWDWLGTYSNVDTLLAYSHFGKKVLEEQSRTGASINSNRIKPLEVKMVTQPGIDTTVYTPLDKSVIKAEFGIPKEFRFVGMASRNQKRKLFPRLIESFRMFKDQGGWKENDPKRKRVKDIDNIKLLLHTCVKDVGFDIPEAISREGLNGEVFFSYICPKCGACAIKPFCGHPIDCPNCKKKEMITPNTQCGFPDAIFTKWFNLLDLYVQGAIAGASEMTIINAKAAGVPTIVTDYAAMSEQGRNGGGAVIKCDLETESETMQWRAWFDRQDLVDKLLKIMKKPKVLQRMSDEARRCAVQYYDWDLTAKKWEYTIDTAELKGEWPESLEVTETPIANLHEVPDLSDSDFIDRCYNDILGRKSDKQGKSDWLNNMKKGQPRDKIEEFFRNETNRKNHAAKLLNNKGAEADPMMDIASNMNPEDTFRIMYCIPETAGDVLISTAIITKLQEKYPQASIYVATQKKYFDILENNPSVEGVFEYNEELLNYRTPEHFGPSPGFVDICFSPFIITQKIPHWIHGGNGESLGVSYAHMCNLTMTDSEIEDKMFIDTEEVHDLPEKYITFHLKTAQDPKDYDRWLEVLERVKNISIVQVGSSNEPTFDHPSIIDFRGKTTPQQLAYVIENAELHLGVDSFPAHVARAVGTRSIILYGGTSAKQIGIVNSVSFEPDNRNGCCTSCYLIECVSKSQGGGKCINNINPNNVVDELCKTLGSQFIADAKPITLSAYCIIKNGEQYKFPYVDCISEALKVVDEFVIVDGGSNDGTLKKLQDMAKLDDRIKVYQHEWDMSQPDLMGQEKTHAKSLCTKDYHIQLDADEMLVEPINDQIRTLIRGNSKVPIFDIPGINMYGDSKTIRIEEAIQKWRIVKADKNIIHGVHGDARELDPTTMSITFDKKVSDSCEFINKNTLKIAPHVGTLPQQVINMHCHMLQLHSRKEIIPEDLIRKYSEIICQIRASMPHTVHLSWNNLGDKADRGDFWNETWHGKNSWTHNTSDNIKQRVEANEDLLIKFNTEIWKGK